MTKQQNLDRDCDYFSSKTFEDILRITFSEDLLFQSTDLRCRDRIINYLNLVSEYDSVKVVVIMSPLKASRCEEYIEFYNMVSNSKLSQDDVLRMCRSFDQLISKIVESNKFFISVNCGKLFPQLTDISLACDYRIISDDTSFQNTFLKLGYLPKGGAAYFLKKRLGHCKACEILLSEKDISAQEAMELGIVNKVVPFEALENEAFSTAKYFARKPATSMTGIKKLLNYSMKDLPDYLEFETQELINVLGQFSLGYKERNR